jgi:hypothetical protein
MAMWTQPWQVTINPPMSGKPSVAAANFGKTATTNGQILDTGAAMQPLPGTSAFARAIVGVSSSTAASESVVFSRTFSLQDSPTDQWLVSLRGFLAGFLFNAVPTSSNPSADVSAGANVPGTPLNISIFGKYKHFASSGTQGGVGTAILANGDYVVSGSLSELVSATGATNATSDFYNGAGGFSVTLTAVSGLFAQLPPPPVPGPPQLFQVSTDEVEIADPLPAVPEPATAVLVATGLVGFVPVVCRRHRSHRAN